jgi:four helix bundle protein
MPQSQKVQSYRQLRTWQKAVDLVEACYALSKQLPRAEEHGMISQLRRSAISIPTNIAEGNGRLARKEYLRYLAIANGSLMEVETLVLLIQRLGYGTPEQLRPITECVNEVGRLLTALRHALQTAPPLATPRNTAPRHPTRAP